MHARALNNGLGALFLVALFLVGVAGSDPPRATFRIHVQTAEAGAPGTQVIPVTLLNPTKQITVRAQPDLSERDIVKVESAPTDNGVALRLTLSEHGRLVLNTLTTENQGRVMVVFLDGRVVYAPIIDKVVSDGVVIIPRAVDPDEVPILEDTLKRLKKE